MRSFIAVMVLFCWGELVTALTGEHVCNREENYTVTTKERFVEPVIIHTLVWCLQVPPRCPETHTEMRERWRSKTEVKRKSVQTCCEGYVIQEANSTSQEGNSSAREAKCAPRCEKCRGDGGACTSPGVCTCFAGFQGQHCERECPQGSWGQNCSNVCDCSREVSCHPVNGICHCPAGWTGPRCEDKCQRGHWGQGCKSTCRCGEDKQADNNCHPETGVCENHQRRVTATTEQPTVDPFEGSGLSVNLIPMMAVSSDDVKAASTGEDFVDVIDVIDEEPPLPKLVELADNSQPSVIPTNLPDDLIPVIIDANYGGGTAGTSYNNAASTTTVAKKTNLELSRTEKPATTRLATVNASNIDLDAERSDFRVIVLPKTDYVKTSRKEAGTSSSTVPIDVAAMIIVGALVSIALTSAGALMVFHLRSRLLKAALSMYNQEKLERNDYSQEKDAKTLPLDVDRAATTLPRGITMTRVNPIYSATTDVNSAVLTFDDGPPEYSNGTVTIGIRLSGNIRDLLESHYDKPSTCSVRSNPSEAVIPPAMREVKAMESSLDAVEHVYDEIPLTLPFYFAKDP